MCGHDHFYPPENMFECHRLRAAGFYDDGFYVNRDNSFGHLCLCLDRRLWCGPARRSVPFPPLVSPPVSCFVHPFPHSSLTHYQLQSSSRSVCVICGWFYAWREQKLEPGKKGVFCRCWQSGTFPLCDGAHVKHNKATGDNVGPLIVAAAKAE